MELKEFVKNVLLDIITGIDEAKKEIDKEGSLICSPVSGGLPKDLGLSNYDANGRYHQNVDFDVAVTVEEETIVKGEAKAKGGIIAVASVSANIDGNLKSTNSTISRIKFHVPIALKAKDCRAQS